MTTSPDSVEALVAYLLNDTIDWDCSPMPDGAEPKASLTCGDLRKAAAMLRAQAQTIAALRSALDNVAYHASQARNCVSEPAAITDERRMVTARWHLDKLIAALSQENG